MIYGDRLEELREKELITIIDMSKILNISDSLYSRYEKEKQIIPITHLNTVCNYFNISLDYAFGFTTTLNYNNNKKELDMNTMIKRLKELRKNNKISQAKLAKELGIANGTIANYETGRNFIATSMLYDLCTIYNISADYLLGKIDKPLKLAK